MSTHIDRSGTSSELITEEQAFQAASRTLIVGFFGVLEVALAEKGEHRKIGPALKRFRMNLSEFQRKVGAVAALQFVGDGVYMNKRLVRTDLSTWQKARFIGEFFDALDIAEVVFNEHVTGQSVQNFLTFARHASMNDEGADSLKERIFPGISCRDLGGRRSTRTDEVVVIPDQIRVVRAYGGIVVSTRHFLDELSRGDPPSVLPLRRALQEFVQLPEHTHSMQLGLLSLEHYRNELAGRQARIGLMVLMMGHRLELGKAELREMGVAAILAGAGRTFSEKKAMTPADQCRELFIKASQTMIPSDRRDPKAALRLITAAELGRLEKIKLGHPLSRMIAVAEAYEHLTTKAPQGPGLTPGEAQQQIVKDRGSDLAAVRLLVATLGLFPVGSMVRLSTGETAIIIEGPRGMEQISQPKVMVVTDERGRPTQKRIVDLRDAELSIAGTVDASKLDLNIGHFIFT